MFDYNCVLDPGLTLLSPKCIPQAVHTGAGLFYRVISNQTSPVKMPKTIRIKSISFLVSLNFHLTGFLAPCFSILPHPRQDFSVSQLWLPWNSVCRLPLPPKCRDQRPVPPHLACLSIINSALFILFLYSCVHSLNSVFKKYMWGVGDVAQW